MSESAVDRAARALDLIPYILKNPGIDLSSIAEKFGITQKQVLADLDIIFLCGLPGYTPYELIDLSYEDGVVTVIDPQVLDKPRLFTESEAIVLNLGLAIMKQALRDESTIQMIEELQDKLESKFKSLSDVSFVVKNPPNFYEVILKAIEEKSALAVTYHSISRDSLSDKVLFPQNIYVSAGNYYMSAIDLGSMQERNYRLDSIMDCAVSNVSYEQSGKLPELPANFSFKILTRNLFLIEKYAALFQSIENIDGDYIASGRIGNAEWLQRLVISNAPDLRLLEPASLAVLIKERVNSAIDLY